MEPNRLTGVKFSFALVAPNVSSKCILLTLPFLSALGQSYNQPWPSHCDQSLPQLLPTRRYTPGPA